VLSNELTLVAIFAHPDDEAFGTGGTLTKYAREGINVHLIMATRGEAGRSANPNIPVTQPMSLLREQELQNACEYYGLAGLHFLDYVDGQTAIVPPSEAVFKIVRLLRRLKPQVVLSFGPEGVYGHFDHLVVHRWATAAVELAAQAERWPEAGPAHQTLKFYHRATPEIQVQYMKERVGRSSVPMDGIPFPFTGYPAEQITTVVDIQAYAQLKLQAIRCYASQINPDMPYLKEDFDPTTIPWFWQETFILAKNSHDLPLEASENDLFAGIR
jgi:LmbE family N-acetylglucosaminyl deacetylase